MECVVEVPARCALGTYANAFRIRKDGETPIMEFLIYSATEDQAAVVGKVAVHMALLPVILDRITVSLSDRTFSARG